MIRGKNSKNLNDISILFVLLALSALLYLKFRASNDGSKPSVNIPESNTSLESQTEKEAVVENTAINPPQSENKSIETDAPEKFNIKVPFTSQAPLYNWDSLHEDACEEASILMLWYWFRGTDLPSKNEIDSEIKSLVSWEEKNNYGNSITLSELSQISARYFPLKGLKIKKVSNADDIKNILASGSPIIVGAAGKILPNPNFRNGGPNYHMLLIKGYDKAGFVTNDPGTRKGENYYYRNDELFKAIHDWDAQNILNGEKNILYYPK